MPYIFVLSPALLMIDTTWSQVAVIMITSIIGMLGISAGVSGYLITHTRYIDRLAFFIGGLLMIDPDHFTDALGLLILAAAYVFQKIMSRRETKLAKGQVK